MTTLTVSKPLVSVVAKDMPLDKCPIGASVFIKKDNRNTYDDKALSCLIRHKNKGNWTFIGFVAKKPEYLPPDGINNEELYSLLDPKKLAAGGTVVDKMTVTYPYGQTATALVVEMNVSR